MPNTKDLATIVTNPRASFLHVSVTCRKTDVLRTVLVAYSATTPEYTVIFGSPCTKNQSKNGYFSVAKEQMNVSGSQFG